MVRLLILGGTRFVGRHIAEAAVLAGWQVTLLHRGSVGTGFLPQVTHLVGDREKDLARLLAARDASGAGRFDAVIDTSGYVPRVVRAAAEALVERAARYVFISSISVYDSFTEAVDERAKTGRLADPRREDIVPETYGPLKVLCEEAATAVFGSDRTTVLRPGLVAGPYDPTDRFTYWVRRAASGGICLAPGDGQRLLQVIDARDLALFALRTITEGLSGIFNVVGDPVPFRELLSVVAAATATSLEPRWLSEAELSRHGVAGWTDMPLFLPGRDQRVGSRRARAAGLRPRPLLETARAVNAWDQWRGRPPLQTGLAAEREAELLKAAAP